MWRVGGAVMWSVWGCDVEGMCGGGERRDVSGCVCERVSVKCERKLSETVSHVMLYVGNSYVCGGLCVCMCIWWDVNQAPC